MIKKLLASFAILFFINSTSFANTHTDQLTYKALRGDGFAAYQLANYYDAQKTNMEDNQKQAVRWYLKSAKAGIESAQIKLAFKYALGTGTPKDMQQAYTWFVIATSGEKPNEKILAYREKAKLELTETQQIGAETNAKKLQKLINSNNT